MPSGIAINLAVLGMSRPRLNWVQIRHDEQDQFQTLKLIAMMPSGPLFVCAACPLCWWSVLRILLTSGLAGADRLVQDNRSNGNFGLLGILFQLLVTPSAAAEERRNEAVCFMGRVNGCEAVWRPASGRRLSVFGPHFCAYARLTQGPGRGGPRRDPGLFSDEEHRRQRTARSGTHSLRGIEYLETLISSIFNHVDRSEVRYNMVRFEFLRIRPVNVLLIGLK